MERVELAPLVGIVGAIAVVGALAVPYVGSTPGSVGIYYGSGVVNPLIAGLLALVAGIVLAAGREGRSDPALAAGIALVFGVAILVTTLLWSLTVRVDVLEVSTVHRWMTAVVSVILPTSALWYARELELL